MDQVLTLVADGNKSKNLHTFFVRRKVEKVTSFKYNLRLQKFTEFYKRIKLR